jgi:hypothetical protein
MCSHARTIKLVRSIALVLIAVAMALVAAVADEEGKQSSEKEKADKTIKIESSERQISPNQTTVLTVPGPPKATGPRKLHRSFLEEAKIFVDKKIVSDICSKQLEGNKSKKEDKSR